MTEPASPPPGEAERIAQLVALLDGIQRATAPPRRSQHPKTVACLTAEFTVSAVPAALAHGVFARPRTYPAWVRFSNAMGWDDRQPDFHGFAIKLAGVPGARLPESDGDPDAQDFLLDDIPVFFTPDIDRTYAFMSRKMGLDAAGKSAEEVGAVLAAEFPTEFARFVSLARPAGPPLELEYWSCVAYRLGPHEVKYYAKPVPAGPPAATRPGSPNFARETVVERLTTRARPAKFEFFVQLREDPATMPIEDATVAWPSPFHKVAELTIPPQTFDTPERDAVGERLSFNPWRALPEHAPLGGLNRARLAAYRASAGYRRAPAGAPNPPARQEPPA
jgi:hypothetical protein